MQTLAQKYPEAHANIQARGYVHIAALMERFGKGVEMDKAMGLRTATSSWCNGVMPSLRSEEIAKRVIMNGCGKPLSAEEAAPIQAPLEPTPTADNDPLMVVCPDGKQAKVMKVLEMLGCEVVAI